MTDVLVVLSTFADQETATRVTRELVERELVACVNILPGITSLYQWEGKLCEEQEVLVLLKSNQKTYPQLEATLQELHPYDEPEVIVLPLQAGSEGYLKFVQRGLRGGRL